MTVLHECPHREKKFYSIFERKTGKLKKAMIKRLDWNENLKKQ
jgi:hypothetical protein